MEWKDELPYWDAAGFGVAEAWEWWLCGYGVPDAIAHRDLGVLPDATLKALRHLRIPQIPENYKRWKGLNEGQIRRAIDRGFKSAKEFRPYEKVAIDADDVRSALAEMGESVSPELLVKYRQLRIRGLEIKQAASWMRSSGVSVEEVVVFVENMLSPTDAQLWHGLGLTALELSSWLKMLPRLDPSSVNGWRSQGIDAELAHWFLGRKISEPDIAKQWLDLAEDLATVEQWLHLGFATPELAKNWYEAYYLPEDAVAWIQVGMSPLQAKLWQKLGKTTEDAAEWKHHQLGVDEALAWLTVHPRITALVARRRRDAGVKP